jgi:hypothetical protein
MSFDPEKELELLVSVHAEDKLVQEDVQKTKAIFVVVCLNTVKSTCFFVLRALLTMCCYREEPSNPPKRASIS